VYFDAIKLYNARPKQTSLGIMMVTNLSSFPSALTVVPVPNGDVKQHRIPFIVNEDLKRMGCSGRSALSLSPPTDASRTKFHQLYRTCDRIPFDTAVIQLVHLCQLALMLFDKLRRHPMHADGLLCDVTEKGIRDWWAEFGTDFYNVEPNDGTLGPTTVSALLGMLMGVRNRLGLCSSVTVPKDAFDFPLFEKAILQFQRQQRLERSGRLDRITMDRLQKTTVKSGPSADIFAVPRAIKSTVVDLSARAVGSSSGPSDATAVETVDIGRFVRSLSGESAKFLWYGKPRKTAAMVTQPDVPSRKNSFDDRAGSLSGAEEPASTNFNNNGAGSSETLPLFGVSGTMGSFTSTPTSSSIEMVKDRDATVSDLRKTVFKTMTGRMKDVASGISAGADYVRGRGHQRAMTKDIALTFGEDYPVTSSPGTSQQRYFNTYSNHASILRGEGKPVVTPPSPLTSISDTRIPRDRVISASPNESIKNSNPWNEKISGELSNTPETAGMATETSAESLVFGKDEGQVCTNGSQLIRRKSCGNIHIRRRHEAFFPRRLSFSLAEDAVLDWEVPFSPSAILLENSLQAAYDWTCPHLDQLEKSLNAIGSNMADLGSILSQKREAVGMAQRDDRERVEAERELVRESIREAEVLGARMEYELGAVKGKLLDLEESVINLAKFVYDVEQDSKGLEREEMTERKKGWFTWLFGR
jgi:hypothetical protein